MQLSSKDEFSICLVSEQLSGGGAERCAALLSIYLQKNNCKVSHVIVIDKVDYQFSGTLYNLGKLKNTSNGFFNRLKRFREMRRIFKANKFDFIVDFRVKHNHLQEVAITKLIYNAPLILSVRSYRTEWYFPKNKFLTSLMYRNISEIVTVSDLIKSKIEKHYEFSNVQTIYNVIDFDFIDFYRNESIELDFEFALAVGRLHEIKQFDQLISAYSKSILVSKGIKLIILGEGKLKEALEKLVKKLKLERMVLFGGNVSNPFQFMSQSKVLLLSSKNEGFPNVVIEALACHTPVISFDCLSGPSEIIINNKNGILVEDQNFEQFTQAMNEIVVNDKLYLRLKHNARKSVLRFSIDIIGKQWVALFKTLKNESTNN